MPYSYFSSLKTAFQHGVGRSSIRFESGLHSPLEVFIGQGKLLLGSSRVFHSIPFAALSELHALIRPGTGFAARSDLQQANQRRNFSVVGAISRTFSTPSVLGPSFQVCEFHIDRLLRSPADSISLRSEKLQNMPMASSNSRALFDNFALDKIPPKHVDLSVSMISRSGLCVKGSFNFCGNARMSLRKPDQPHNNLVYGFFVYNVARKFCNPNSYLESGLKGFHSSSAASLSAGSVPDVSFENTSRDEVLTNSMASSDQNPSSDRTLKLLSGSYYLPHPDKEETGGEDAHFICIDKQAIGVADGVGGWADLGVDSGKYARELMSNSVAAVKEEPKGLVDPARVLEKAHSSTKAKGSSTACIIALTAQGLHAVNLGDSGFMVVRDGCTVFRSPVQQHDFNFTYQLESGINGDLPSSGQIFTVSVAPGDVIIAGTDGLFDNLYNNEVTGVVIHAVRAGLGPQAAAQKIAALARERAQDKNRQTPFSTAAQDAGYRYYGGKLDDITVVVSYITSDTTENQSAQSAGCASG